MADRRAEARLGRARALVRRPSPPWDEVFRDLEELPEDRPPYQADRLAFQALAEESASQKEAVRRQRQLDLLTQWSERERQSPSLDAWEKQEVKALGERVIAYFLAQIDKLLARTASTWTSGPATGSSSPESISTSAPG